MKWYWISAITLCAYWAIGLVIAAMDHEEWLVYWSTGLMYPIAYVLFYPIRAWNSYSKSYLYFEKHNITRLQYLFGKRVRRNDEDD